MAALSTGLVGAVRFKFLAEDNERIRREQFARHLTDSPDPRSGSPVLLDSEKPDPSQFTADLWPQPPASGELVWLSQQSDTLDLRHSRPVSRHKLLVLRSPARPSPEWLLGWRTERAEDRGAEERGRRLLSTPSSRCQEWSTLRQLLPSRGRPEHRGHRPGWESGGAALAAPVMTDRPATAFPKINSEMTRYCDAMFVNDKNFWNR